MNLLARAHGLQERIRPIMYLVSRGRLGNVRTVEGECGPTTRGREVLPVPNHYGVAPASKLSTREAGRFIYLLTIGEGVRHAPPPFSTFLRGGEAGSCLIYQA